MMCKFGNDEADGVRFFLQQADGVRVGSVSPFACQFHDFFACRCAHTAAVVQCPRNGGRGQPQLLCNIDDGNIFHDGFCYPKVQYTTLSPDIEEMTLLSMIGGAFVFLPINDHDKKSLKRKKPEYHVTLSGLGFMLCPGSIIMPSLRDCI